MGNLNTTSSGSRPGSDRGAAASGRLSASTTQPAASAPASASAPATNASTSCCSICLSIADARGGRALTSPGCCGTWFHQDCIDQMIATGNQQCPNCRASFPCPAASPPSVNPVANYVMRPMNRPNRRSVYRGGGRSLRTFGLEEDLLDVVPASNDTSQARAEATEEAGNPSITVSCTPERNAIGIDATDEFYVNVNLKASQASSAIAKRTPLDLVCVLDNSGSMSGDKLESVKEAMSFVHRQLGPQDRLSLVVFNSDATTMHGLLKMTDAKKENSRTAMDSVYSTGGTDIYSGMLAAVDILKERKTKNAMSTIFLLTDGCDSSRMGEKMKLAQEIRAMGSSLYVFGFGDDHDSDQLQSIANASEGDFTFIEADDMAPDAFGGALGGQSGLVGRDINLTVSIPEAVGRAGGGVTSSVFSFASSKRAADAGSTEVLRVFSGRYTHSISTDKRSATVSFANMFAGENRDVLVRLKISAGEPTDAFHLLNASASYTTLDGVEMQAVPSMPVNAPATINSDTKINSIASSPCYVRRAPGAKGEIDIEVDAQRQRCAVADALDDIVATTNHRNIDAKRGQLDKLMKMVKESTAARAQNAISTSLLEDIEEASKNLKDEETYFTRGGKASITECSQTNSKQRATYTKAHKRTVCYQTVTSMGMQEQAFAFKKSSKK